MFVRQSTYDKLEIEKLELTLSYQTLLLEFNSLVKRVNAKGGEDFLDNGGLNHVSDFSSEEIKQMITLCHPDKHNGKPASVSITQKLIKIKGGINNGKTN